MAINDFTVWIMIYLLEFAVLARVIIHNHLKKKTYTVISKNLPIIGSFVVIFGTFAYLISYGGLFMFEESTDQCLAAYIAQKTNVTDEVFNCVYKDHDFKLNLFLFGGIASIVIMIASVLQTSNQNLGNKN